MKKLTKTLPKPQAKRVAAKKKVAGAKTPAAKGRATKTTKLTKTTKATKTAKAPASAARKVGPRADLGAPIDGFFAKQPAHLRPILDRLRELVEEAAPDASSSIKWGMPFYAVGDNLVCAMAGFKAHVNLILPGPPGTYADPDARLEGDGKTGKHLKLRTLDDLPQATVRGWLRLATERARHPPD